jgi:nucleoside-diphosphate-sugar epimerase
MPQVSSRPRVVVLGGGGFVGSRLVRRLAATGGFEVRCAFRGHGGPAGVEEVHFDLLDVSSIRQVIRDADLLVNCTKGDHGTIVKGTRVLIKSCTDSARSPRLLHLSSMSVYDDAAGPVDEDRALARSGNWYVRAKVSADLQLREWQAGGYPVLILRPGVVIGEGDLHWSYRLPRLVERGILGNLGVAGSGPANLLDVDDLACVIESLLAMNRWKWNVLNIAAPGYGDWNSVFEAIAVCIGAGRHQPVPRWRLLWESFVRSPAIVVADRMARAASPVPAQRRTRALLTPSMTRLFASRLRLDTTRLESMLKVPWSPTQSTLKRVTRWSLSREGP